MLWLFAFANVWRPFMIAMLFSKVSSAVVVANGLQRFHCNGSQRFHFEWVHIGSMQAFGNVQRLYDRIFVVGPNLKNSSWQQRQMYHADQCYSSSQLQKETKSTSCKLFKMTAYLIASEHLLLLKSSELWNRHGQKCMESEHFSF